MTEHWSATAAEGERPELAEVLWAIRSKPLDLTDARLDRTMRKMKLDKACGDDEVPIEFWESVPEARRDLYDFIRTIFADRTVPDSLVVVLFVMIYKGAKKGTVNEFEAYRPIGLMRHTWKLVESVFLEELIDDTEL